MQLPTPVSYSESLESPERDEEQTATALRDTLREIMLTTQADYGHAVRSVHAKSHALLVGTFSVHDNLPEPLAQGIFSEGSVYPFAMRISTIPGDLLDDGVSVPRGIAVKVLDVQGDRLPGSERDRTQDFVLANAPAFAAPNASGFLSNLKLLSKTTDRAEWAKKALSTVLRGVEKGIEAVGRKSPLLTTLGGHPLTHPAGDTYYSQTPFRFGDYVAKFQIAPVSGNLIALTGKEIALAGRADAWREEFKALFAAQGARWDFRVQLLTDLLKMPVEDSSVVWPEDISPYISVATLDVGPQTAWSNSRAVVGDDQLAFSPWHGIAAHRPLGSINRVRQQAYKMSATERASFNRCPIHEPRGDFSLPA